MKIIAFAGSNSSTSINHQLAIYSSSLVENGSILKLTNYSIPIYNIDIEVTEGIPEGVKKLAEDLSDANAFIISVAEHNGNVTSFFKNILDWLSRNDRDFLKGKKIVLLSTSPGGRGGVNALEISAKMLPYFGGEVVGKMSVGSFSNVFKEGKIIDEKIDSELIEVLKTLN